MGWMVIIGQRSSYITFVPNKNLEMKYTSQELRMLSSVPIYYEATIRMLVIEGLKFQFKNHRQKLTIRKTFETISIS